jgi:predicted RNase H-like nuclease
VKKELGKKGSSIFEVPCRQAVYAEDKKVARERNIAILGKSLSEQTLGIAKAIKQVDEFLQSKPQWKNRLLESHPEFCFSKLNNNQPILEHKTSAEGQQKRLGILRKYYPKADQVVEKFLADVPYRKKIDDVVDALCLAVMGRLILEKGLKTIPKKPMMDDKGILMQMVYAE